MKKLILLFLLAVPLNSFADVWFKSTALAIRINGIWSDWVPTIVKIKVTETKITIYSDEVQVYRIKEETENPYDSKGNQLAYYVIDQDGDRGRIRFRKQYNGILQLYIDFNDIGWVYDNLK